MALDEFDVYVAEGNLYISEKERAELKSIIKRIYIETTTDHYGDATLALTEIDKILEETRCLWDREDN